MFILTVMLCMKNKKKGDKRSLKHGGTGRSERVNTRSMVRGGEGRSDRVDTRSMVRGGEGRLDMRNMIKGGEGRTNTSVSEVQDKEHCQLRSSWWQCSSDCALLASACLHIRPFVTLFGPMRNGCTIYYFIHLTIIS